MSSDMLLSQQAARNAGDAEESELAGGRVALGEHAPNVPLPSEHVERYGAEWETLSRGAWTSVSRARFNRPFGRRQPVSSAIRKVSTVVRERAPGQWSIEVPTELWLARAIPDLFRESALIVPRVLEARYVPPFRVEVWLEDIMSLADEWTVDEFCTAANVVGEFNRRRQSEVDRWPGGSSAAAAARVEPEHIAILIRNCFRWPECSATTLADLAYVISMFDRSMSVLEGGLQTVCHNDVTTYNARCYGHRCAVVGWSFVGRGHVGAELSALVGASFQFGRPLPALPEDIDERVVAAYIEGLGGGRQARVVEAVWTGYAASAVQRLLRRTRLLATTCASSSPDWKSIDHFAGRFWKSVSHHRSLSSRLRH